MSTMWRERWSEGDINLWIEVEEMWSLVIYLFFTKRDQFSIQLKVQKCTETCEILYSLQCERSSGPIPKSRPPLDAGNLYSHSHGVRFAKFCVWKFHARSCMTSMYECTNSFDCHRWSRDFLCLGTVLKVALHIGVRFVRSTTHMEFVWGTDDCHRLSGPEPQGRELKTF